MSSCWRCQWQARTSTRIMEQLVKARLFGHLPARPLRLIDLHTCPTRKYSSKFEVFKKIIQRICPICLVFTGHNGQDYLPTRPLEPPYSLRTLSVKTLRKGQGHASPILNPLPSLQCFCSHACTLSLLLSISKRN